MEPMSIPLQTVQQFLLPLRRVKTAAATLASLNLLSTICSHLQPTPPRQILPFQTLQPNHRIPLKPPQFPPPASMQSEISTQNNRLDHVPQKLQVLTWKLIKWTNSIAKTSKTTTQIWKQPVSATSSTPKPATLQYQHTKRSTKTPQLMFAQTATSSSSPSTV